LEPESRRAGEPESRRAGERGIGVKLSTAKIACILWDIVNHEAHEDHEEIVKRFGYYIVFVSFVVFVVIKTTEFAWQSYG